MGEHCSSATFNKLFAMSGVLVIYLMAMFNLQIEEALVRRKKMELLQKYASEALMAQSEEAKRLLGL